MPAACRASSTVHRPVPHASSSTLPSARTGGVPGGLAPVRETTCDSIRDRGRYVPCAETIRRTPRRVPGSRPAALRGVHRPRSWILRRFLRSLGQLGLYDQTLAVVGQRAGLEREYVLARQGICNVGSRRANNEGLEDVVGVPGTVSVGDVDLVSADDVAQVPEGQPALGVWVAKPVARDVDVGLVIPGKPVPSRWMAAWVFSASSSSPAV